MARCIGQRSRRAEQMGGRGKEQWVGINYLNYSGLPQAKNLIDLMRTAMTTEMQVTGCAYDLPRKGKAGAAPAAAPAAATPGTAE